MPKKEDTKNRKMVTVILPRDPNKKGPGADEEYFSVNFKGYLIKTDVPVQVPEEVAEVINNVADARRKGRLYAEKIGFKKAK